MFNPGTLTQNEMVFRRLHLGTVAYGMDSMDEVQSHVFSAYTQVKKKGHKEEEAHKSMLCFCQGEEMTATEKSHWHLESKQKHNKRFEIPQAFETGLKQTDRSIVLRNISVCDYCLVECFLTSDDTLCPPLTPEVSEAGNRISPQAKHWPDFFNDATINPWNANGPV